METNKLIAVFLPILAIVTVMIVTIYFPNKRISKAQKRIAIGMMLAGIAIIVILTATVV